MYNYKIGIQSICWFTPFLKKIMLFGETQITLTF